MEFTAGQEVTWSQRADLAVCGPYGNGPFKIDKVETVPADICTCGNRLDDGYHDGGCFYNNSGTGGYRYRPVRESVGYSQFVWIKMPDGEHQFSGAYFTAI